MNNDDFSEALLAKSLQINAVDLAGDTLVKIVNAVFDPKKEQPMDIYLDGFKLPWKPSKGMRRIIAKAWKTTKCSELVGRHLIIFNNEEVTFGSDKTGGIQIKAMEGIPKEGINTTIRKGRKPVPYRIECLEPPAATMYPNDQFEAALPQMLEAMKNGWTLEQIIAKCSEVGQLTESQLERLR